MARPIRKDVDYFPHLIGGDTMSFIEDKYGNDGYAIWFKILEKLGKTDDHYLDLNKPLELKRLAGRCKVSDITLLSIIDDLVEMEEFDSYMWKQRVLWNQKFVDSIQDAYIKRKNKCITYAELNFRLYGFRHRNEPGNSVSGAGMNPETLFPVPEIHKEEESKEKKKKEEESESAHAREEDFSFQKKEEGPPSSADPPVEFVPPTRQEVAEEFKRLGLNGKSEEEAVKFESHYKAIGWMIGKNRMVNWIAAAESWKSKIPGFAGKVSGSLDATGKYKASLPQTTKQEEEDPEKEKRNLEEFESFVEALYLQYDDGMVIGDFRATSRIYRLLDNRGLVSLTLEEKLVIYEENKLAYKDQVENAERAQAFALKKIFSQWKSENRNKVFEVVPKN